MKRKKKIAAVIAGLFAAYFLTYVFDSAAGGYWPIPDDAGSNIQSFGEPEDILWQPRYGYSSARWSSALGIFYAPLIRIDREWRHNTYGFEDDGPGMYFQSNRPLTDYHPETREYVRLARALYRKRDKRSRREIEADPDFIRLRAENERMFAETGWNSR